MRGERGGRDKWWRDAWYRPGGPGHFNPAPAGVGVTGWRQWKSQYECGWHDSADQETCREQQAPTVAPAVEFRPRPGETWGPFGPGGKWGPGQLYCVVCKDFMAAEVFHKSQQKWSLSARECIVCRDAKWGSPAPHPSLQPPAQDITPPE